MIPSAVRLALFDLDDTLLDGDITVLWNEWLIEQGWITDVSEYRRIWDSHMVDYAAGTLDMEAHLAFLLTPLVGRKVQDVANQVHVFLDSRIIPRLFPGGLAQLAWHREKGHTIIIISASTLQLVLPLAKRLGCDVALATDLEQQEGRYTGLAQGTRTFKEGKLAALKEWLGDTPLLETWGYSDSHNDLPLLESVENPHAVHPDPVLADIARQRDWAILSWR